MSEHKQAAPEPGMPHVSVQAAEPEFYEEPPRMTGADIAGVLFALLALTLIGFGGYVWLNPELDFSDIQQRFAHKPVASSPAAETPAPPAAQQEPMKAEEPMAATAPSEAQTRDSSCPFCGMFTDRTLGLVVASWSDGTSTHHDSWGCVHNYQKEQGLTLSSARVLDYNSGLTSRSELDAKAASYLFGIHKLEGSMAPYVAAFRDSASAAAAQAQLGGEVVDFAGLEEKLK